MQALGRLAASMAIVMGLVIVVGGEGRWIGPSYKAALAVPGAPESWGMALGAVGLLTLAGSLLGSLGATRLGLYGIAVWALFFAISVAKAAYYDPHAGTTGIIAYFYIAIQLVVLAVAHKR